MKPETVLWLDKAEGHLKAAGVLLEAGLYSQCVFFCQQAIEVLLKAIWVERTPNNMPPHIHRLVELAEGLGLRLSEEHLAILDDLTTQYIPARYSDVPIEYSREEAETYLVDTREVFAWLRPHLT